ncbi:MAG: glycoside hydrolase family 15 protein [Nevskia sp.]|jgi:GH15 family glucan-1,4-alpha-glucosidase|nr:glycoside hydrolase family 15 protein [Nevskia sp.]MCK9386153.1 glycoside hydrolase family 15 protein [Nevskia sp.]
MNLENLGLIGNCQYSALISNNGSVVWCCLPRFDSEPVFGSLLDPDGGDFSIAPADGGSGRQRYLENTNVLETVFDAPGGRFRVLDFAPRFSQNERMFRPTQLVRIVEPLEGTPLVRVRFDPRLGWSKAVPQRLHGSNHIRVEGYAKPLRLTSDISPTHLEGQPFALTQRRHLMLAWGAPVEEALAPLCGHFLTQTMQYWQGWVKHCNIPPIHQQEVIRSALALKLHCFEDTGAIVAALTTSIPEAPGSGRTWDYRYCWLRDAYYVLDALRLLGHFEEREQFIHYLLGIAASAPDLNLRPLYRVDGSSDLEEHILDNWAGYEGNGPVRIGNGAAVHEQHDVYGETVLALAPIYFDDRFALDRTPSTLDLLERLAGKAIAVAGTPDAGIWEFRKAWEPQTFSSLMCWAAVDRVARITARHRPARAPAFAAAAQKIHSEIIAHAWSAERGSFTATYGGSEVDAALLQMAPLRFLPASDPRLTATVDAVARDLGRDGWLYRYRNDDGLGVPEVAFVICTFWMIDALAATGRREEAMQMMTRVRKLQSPLGLLAEDYATTAGRMWGNFPQAYSHVGLIHAAFSTSPNWSEFL